MTATLFGAAYSVYVRMARLALIEKGVDHDLVDVDVFGPGGPPADHLARHPFGRIPAFDHDGFALYETSAITRYVDEAFPGPALLPAGPHGRARAAQIVAMLDSYGYRPLVWGLFVERIRAPAQGRAPDEEAIARAQPQARTFLAALEALCGDGPWLVGPALSLADLHAAPIFAYFTLTPDAAGLLAPHPRLRAWWQAMAARPSVQATRSALEPSGPQAADGT
jgi:glutathione S-transferase